MDEIIIRTTEIRKAIEEVTEGAVITAWSRSEFMGQWSQFLTYKLKDGGELVVTLREPMAQDSQ